MEKLSRFYNLFQAAAAALEKLSGVLEENATDPDRVAPSALPAAAGKIRFDVGCRDRTGPVRQALSPGCRPNSASVLPFVAPDEVKHRPSGPSVAAVGQRPGAAARRVVRVAVSESEEP